MYDSLPYWALAKALNTSVMSNTNWVVVNVALLIRCDVVDASTTSMFSHARASIPHNRALLSESLNTNTKPSRTTALKLALACSLSSSERGEKAASSAPSHLYFCTPLNVTMFSVTSFPFYLLCVRAWELKKWIMTESWLRLMFLLMQCFFFSFYLH